ncbi:CBS domain-containing protein [Niveibacterium sp. SC-1]|uniref:CBS domain-containing protein n=1 Tax=Niveibacterium sp. SC-1 TaxID=3135646 RepID=UPI0031200A40
MSHRPISEIIAGRKLVVAKPGMSVREAARLMKREAVGAVLVVEDDRLRGIFTERDALNRVLAEGLSPDDTQLAAVMTADPITVEDSRAIGYALHLMHENSFRHVPVTHAGKAIGMVSVRDALGPEMVEFEHELERREELTEIL